MNRRPAAHPTLTRLEVQALATIDTLELDLGGGLSVFTGETGAGKSIIVDALGLLLGERARTDLIRRGEDQLLVTGFWQAEGEEAISSRRVSRQGRSVARLDGEVVALRELSGWTAERLTIHWQHSAVSLLTHASQRRLLDSRCREQAQAYAGAYAAWQAAAARLERLQAGQRERARTLDLLQYQVTEIREVAPAIGEEEPLQAQLSRLTHQEAIAGAAEGTLELLSDGEVSAEGLLQSAARTLAAGARHDEVSAQLLEELRSALESVAALVPELRTIAEASAPDPEEVAQIEGRLAALGKLRNKYGPELSDVLTFLTQAEAELEGLSRDEADAGSLEGEVARLYAELQTVGAELDQARTQAAHPLAESLLAVIRELGMPHARLEFGLTLLPQPTSGGLSDVTLIFSANPGENMGPLAEVASGGELSRVMLAISTVVGADTPVVIFDEVDAGIGGAAAVAVADQLATLGKGRQVMVVTHLAQIAARADHHYRVEKEVLGGRTISRVRRLDPAEREAELARMLGGQTSGAALDHARELLEQGAGVAKASTKRRVARG
ncbi:DNA repair protein RecN [Deinococcus radiophilus]|uniref:DNA repair protein RecN n=1 Tax=Deinococcus radiophilus TaxID=32062 RepID=A0A431W0N3_9DEIO|nr:DNA repair protein RecN [Deinococcus radiophilus]RTR28689.1 DNA repair protein RecN [Deinococcus radiophilus]UFA51112.1 DNA repair protein RecN [Deinococcus radiophilus]